MDGTKIKESWVGIEVEKLVVRIKIQDSQVRIENYEEWNTIEIHNIGIGTEIQQVWKIENLWPIELLCPRTKIWN
jgi:hypothetical protein